MIRTFVVGFLLFAGLALHVNHETEGDIKSWKHYKAAYGLAIQHELEDYRRKIFEHNLAKINTHNADPTQTYKMGVNHFTIYTQQEFAHLFLNPPHFASKNTKTVTHLKRATRQMHMDIDWVSNGKVPGVKNQGQCTAGWAFATTGAVESFFRLKGQIFALSEQQLIDCSRPQGNAGCDGGWPSSGLNYIKANGITTKAAYPYVARDQACKIQGGSIRINGFNSFIGCNALTAQINNSPIAVAVDSGNWQSYRSGVFSNCATSIDHSVLLVGIVGGAWKIQNSWGTGWGEAGYIRLALGNTCGICNYAGVVPN